MDKPFIAAADNNKDAILAVLTEQFADVRSVLEIGAGTGQHAVHFARALPHLVWQATDLEPALPGIRAWIEEAALPNLPPPRALDASRSPWPVSACDAVYAANTVHYMTWTAVTRMFANVAETLRAEGRLALYGPFNYAGRYLSDGNRRLDAWLRAQHPDFGIRDVEALVVLAARHGLELGEDWPMPVNNRLLIWRR